MPVEDWSKIIAASVVPVVIISACGLMCLAFYNRLASIVSRLRTFQRERLQEQEWLASSGTGEADATVLQRHQQLLEMLDVQTQHVTERAHLIQRTLLSLLGTIGCLVLCSLSLGLSVVWADAVYLATVFFIVGLVLMFVAVAFAVSELRSALEPVELESRFVARLAEEIDTGEGA